MPQVVYGTVYLDWKLQNNREKQFISRKKQFYRSLLVENLEKLAKNRQVGIICNNNFINVKETRRLVTNKQTNIVL